MSGLAWHAGQREVTGLCRVVCESAAVTVASYPTGNGLRLQLISERSGAEVLLDATVLEALCHLNPRALAEIVRLRTEGSAGEARCL
jgi:hypothetical protein